MQSKNTKTSECRICHKRFKVLAEGICFFCDNKHWVAYWNKVFTPKK